MKILQEFKEFAARGNVVDMAVGVILGGAFGKIVSSLVSDVTMPLVGLFFGKINFSNLFIALGSIPSNIPHTLEAVRNANIPVLAYGSFVTAVIDFLIIAFVIFMLVKQINRLRKSHDKPAEEPVTPSEDIALLREIRDCLREQQQKHP